MLQDFRCIAAHWPFARIDSSQYPDIESFAISSRATPTDQGLSGTTIGMCANSALRRMQCRAWRLVAGHSPPCDVRS